MTDLNYFRRPTQLLFDYLQMRSKFIVVNERRLKPYKGVSRIMMNRKFGFILIDCSSHIIIKQ